GDGHVVGPACAEHADGHRLLADAEVDRTPDVAVAVFGANGFLDGPDDDNALEALERHRCCHVHETFSDEYRLRFCRYQSTLPARPMSRFTFGAQPVTSSRARGLPRRPGEE